MWEKTGRDDLNEQRFMVFFIDLDGKLKHYYNVTVDGLINKANLWVQQKREVIVLSQDTCLPIRLRDETLRGLVTFIKGQTLINKPQADGEKSVLFEETRSARKVAAEYMGEKKQWSRKLIEFRKEHNLSQQELASLLEVTISSVEGWEECKHKPLANSALKIGALFNKFNGAGAVTKLLRQSPEERLIGQIDKKAFERLVRTKAPKNIIARGLNCTEQLIDTWCNAVYGERYFTVKRRLLKGRI